MESDTDEAGLGAPRSARPANARNGASTRPRGGIRLVIQADDFGMCHAVNAGIVEAFEHGLLTQAQAMAPCPSFPEAAGLAVAHGIPVGLHCTLTSEWTHLRWGPLTGGASLVGPDGTFHRSIEAARQRARPEEAALELMAQADRLKACDIDPVHVDAHMGLVVESAYRATCRHLARPFLYPLFDPSLALTSFAILSEVPAHDKRDWLLAYLDRLPAGAHLLQTHPALPSPELRALTDPHEANAPWAEAYRVSDLEALLDPRARAIVDHRGIELVTVDEVDVYDATGAGPARCEFTMA